MADDTTQHDAPATADQPVGERGSNRSQRPSSEAFRAFMTQQWGGARPTVSRDPVADHTPARRGAISELFPGERLVIPAGGLLTRSNDTDYRFRPHSAFAHLTGLGIDLEPDAVLVLHPREDGGHDAVLYIRPMAGRRSRHHRGRSPPVANRVSVRPGWAATEMVDEPTVVSRRWSS